MKYKHIVFCDFDGTITTKETLEGFIQLFIKEDIFALAEDMVRRDYTVVRAIREMMGLIPSCEYSEKTDYFKNLPMRGGFGELLDFLEERGIPIVILSGGIQEMVDISLAKYRHRLLDVYSAKVDLSGEKVYFYSDYESDIEMVDKMKVMSLYDCETSICIGDSYTDFNMGKKADITFARDRLAKAMEKEGREYHYYDSFFDVIDSLKKLLA